MKKFKKLLAGLLTGAMLLGSMSVSAFAEDTAAPKTPVIDENERGSITIHKYEYNETVTTHGTGETTDASKVPTPGAKPLQGAGFTIYKVAGVDDLKTYYSEDPTTLPTVDNYVTDGKIKSEFETKKVIDKNGVYEKTTDSAGIAEFTGLELGFYVVIETKTPDKVTTPVDPFLVSIPMTVKSGDNWLYNVNVYPKNKTTYGRVTLQKQGKDNTPLQGVKFVLQKQNETSWTNVTINENTNATLDLTTNANGQIIVDGLSQGTYRFIETDRGTNDGYIMDGATAYQFTVKVNDDGKVTYTYGSKRDAANITIDIVNEKPDMTKKVQNTAGKPEQGADYSVGDLVPYQITISVPKNIDKLKTFTLTDTPTNLKDDVTSVKVTDETGRTPIPAKATATEDGNGFTIDFTQANLVTYAGQDIIVTYNAELLSTAEKLEDGNSNTATLEYSNKILPEIDDGSNPNKPNKPEEKPTTDKITDTAIVYSFTIQVLKKADKADGAALKDVTFEVYKGVDKNTQNAITGDAAKNKGLKSEEFWLKIGDLTTDKDGMAEQKGLSNGTYYLVETKTNQDYNLLKAPVKVILNIAYTTTTKAEYYTTKDGIRTLVKHEVEKTEFTTKKDGATSNGIEVQTVINKKGFELPLTGGMGTVLFSVIGLALVLAGVVVITASRKKTAK